MGKSDNQSKVEQLKQTLSDLKSQYKPNNIKKPFIDNKNQ